MNEISDGTQLSICQSAICTGWFKIIVGVSVAYNFQTGNNKIKLLTEYESVTQKVLCGNAVLAALMYGRKYDVIPPR
jgi:hypothetical protein